MSSVVNRGRKLTALDLPICGHSQHFLYIDSQCSFINSSRWVEQTNIDFSGSFRSKKRSARSKRIVTIDFMLGKHFLSILVLTRSINDVNRSEQSSMAKQKQIGWDMISEKKSLLRERGMTNNWTKDDWDRRVRHVAYRCLQQKNRNTLSLCLIVHVKIY